MAGPQSPAAGLDLAGTLRDALPDAWGQRIAHATTTAGSDTDEVALADLMLASSSDRFGAIDFQASAIDYAPRTSTASLEMLAAAAAVFDDTGIPPTDATALRQGAALGGARPKAAYTDGFGTQWIAKFESASDRGPTIRAEAAALELARDVGITVPRSRIRMIGRTPVLLIKRFDRGPRGTRYQTTSMLSVLGLTEMNGRYATYPDFLDRLDGDAATELFTRIAFNIAIGNTDDHARNHAAHWDGHHLTLAPAYDLDPTARTTGHDANQAIAYSRTGTRTSSLASLVGACDDYGLSALDALGIAIDVATAVDAGWERAAKRAGMTDAETAEIRARSILRDAAVSGLPGFTDRGRDLPGGG